MICVSLNAPLRCSGTNGEEACVVCRMSPCNEVYDVQGMNVNVYSLRCGNLCWWCLPNQVHLFFLNFHVVKSYEHGVLNTVFVPLKNFTITHTFVTKNLLQLEPYEIFMLHSIEIVTNFKCICETIWFIPQPVEKKHYNIHVKCC